MEEKQKYGPDGPKVVTPLCSHRKAAQNQRTSPSRSFICSSSGQVQGVTGQIQQSVIVSPSLGGTSPAVDVNRLPQILVCRCSAPILPGCRRVGADEGLRGFLLLPLRRATGALVEQDAPLHRFCNPLSPTPLARGGPSRYRATCLSCSRSVLRCCIVPRGSRSKRAHGASSFSVRSRPSGPTWTVSRRPVSS